MINFITNNIIPILIGAAGIFCGVMGTRASIKSNKELKRAQEAEASATKVRKEVEDKLAEVQKQKEKDLTEVPKDAKTRVKKANDKIKDFNSKI